MVPAAVAVSAHAVVSASDVVPAISIVAAELRCSAERPYPDALCRCGRAGWCRARSSTAEGRMVRRLAGGGKWIPNLYEVFPVKWWYWFFGAPLFRAEGPFFIPSPHGDRWLSRWSYDFLTKSPRAGFVKARRRLIRACSSSYVARPSPKAASPLKDLRRQQRDMVTGSAIDRHEVTQPNVLDPRQRCCGT